MDKLGFGIETEHCLIDSKTFTPLFADELEFDQLLTLIDGIPVSDFGDDELNIKPLHRKASPYLIEGYYLVDEAMKAVKLLPKGIEVRTPICSTIEQSVSSVKILTERLQQEVAKRGWNLCSISHHPLESNFIAPPNYKRHDHWQWALAAMTTYGPDINISLPEEILKGVDRESLNFRLNYYLPPVVALTFASPLLNGGLWRRDGTIGKSVRTFNRSLWAPLYYVHTEPTLRFEFKGFEMPTDINDYKAMFLIGLSMLLDNSLAGRASDDERVRSLRSLALTGLQSAKEKMRAREVLESAERIGEVFRIDSSPLRSFWKRLETGLVPSDHIIELFHSTGTIADTMKHLSVTSSLNHISLPAYAAVNV